MNKEIDPVPVMNMFLPLMKETIVGDVIVVPEHRCDIHDTQARQALHFMSAYSIDTLKAIIHTGTTIIFRKVTD